jgi:hypothetical protein
VFKKDYSVNPTTSKESIMKRPTQTLLAISTLALSLGAAMPASAHQGDQHAMTALSSKADQTDAALRDLWIGHVFWVRNVVAETLAGNSAAAAAAEKEVVGNAKQIAAAIEPFYGKAAADKLFDLLAAHYGAVKQYLEATAANSQPKQEAAQKVLTSNAGEIAAFLSGANPNLPLEALRGMLLAHGGHHIQQIQQLHDKQYGAEAQTWGAMKNHMYEVADALTGALAKQFPAKFQ